MNAAAAANQVDHDKSIAYNTNFSVDVKSSSVRDIVSTAYLQDLLDEETLQRLDLDESVTDEDIEKMQRVIEQATSIEDIDLPSEIDCSSVEEAAEDCSLTDEQLKMLVELQSNLDTLSETKEAEMNLVAEGNVGHVAAVEAILILAVAVVVA